MHMKTHAVGVLHRIQHVWLATKYMEENDQAITNSNQLQFGSIYYGHKTC